MYNNLFYSYKQMCMFTEFIKKCVIFSISLTLNQLQQEKLCQLGDQMSKIEIQRLYADKNNIELMEFKANRIKNRCTDAPYEKIMKTIQNNGIDSFINYFFRIWKKIHSVILHIWQLDEICFITFFIIFIFSNFL